MAVRCDHHAVVGDADDVVSSESVSNASGVLFVRNLVRDDGDVALVAFGGDEHCSLADVDGARRGLDDHECRLDRSFGQAGQCADACFEVGDDDGVRFRYGAEQLLSGKPTSRSIRFGIVDSVDHREANSIGGVGPVCLEDVVPGVCVFLVAFVDLVAQRQEPFGFEIANAKR